MVSRNDQMKQDKQINGPSKFSEHKQAQMSKIKQTILISFEKIP